MALWQVLVRRLVHHRFSENTNLSNSKNKYQLSINIDKYIYMLVLLEIRQVSILRSTNRIICRALH